MSFTEKRAGTMVTVGQSLVGVVGVTALGMALAEPACFWIADTARLASVLSARPGSTTMIGGLPW